MLNELTGEQITAIGGVIVALIVGLAEWARRSANKAVAPVSGSGDNAGVGLLIDPKQASLIISELGVIETATRANTSALDRNTDANDRVLKSVNGMRETLHEVRDELRDEREEMREHRALMKQEREQVREELRQHRSATKADRDGLVDEVRDGLERRFPTQD